MQHKTHRRGPEAARSWTRLRHAIEGQPLPCALVDLDALDTNIDRLLAPVRASKKRLRLATKSLRSPALIEYIVKRAGDAVCGLMTYAAEESAFLASDGRAIVGEAANDLLLAYPTVQASDLAHLVTANRSASCSAIVDEETQVHIIDKAARSAGVRIPLVIDIDMSWRPLGQLLHIGVRRSPLRTADSVVALARKIAACDGVRFAGVMGYEAQIAGLTDESPFHAIQNGARQALKTFSRVDVEQARSNVVRALGEAGLAPEIVNGGGTGSIGSSTAEAALTEVTVGSGFLDPHLFDYYKDLALEPAALFALQVVRRPAPGLVTCHGGGYIASGDGGRDRLPLPWLPAGCQLVGLEGAGEVQTPIVLPDGLEISLGDPIFFRHAKAGELAEHFNHFLLVRGDAIVGTAQTYRGLGRSFLG